MMTTMYYSRLAMSSLKRGARLGVIMTNKSDNTPDSPMNRFGAELRRYRKHLGLSQGRLGQRLGLTQGMVSHLERGTRSPTQDHAENLDRIFNLSEKKYFSGLYRYIAEPAAGPAWFTDWAEEIDPRARVIRSWDPLLIPGLLQTEAYAWHIFNAEPEMTPEEVQRCVAARTRRREILNHDSPPSLLALIGEGVLHQQVGGGEVMHAQLEYLLELAQQPNVTIQIVDSDCLPGKLGAFMIAQLPDGEPDAILADSSARGFGVVDPDLVRSVWKRYDAIRTWAYPGNVSLKMIREVNQQWT